jgi:cytochrome-b5 reductase
MFSIAQASCLANEGY